MTAELPVRGAACPRLLVSLLGTILFLMSTTASANWFFDFERPQVAITSPVSGTTYATNAATVALAGTASDNLGVTRVTWRNDRGGRGLATGTTNWSVGSIALAAGVNKLFVTAHDRLGRRRTAELTVTYTASTPDAVPEAKKPTADTSPPAAPAALDANPVSSSQIKLAWKAASDNIAVVAYLLERCQDAGCLSFRQIGKATSTAYSDAGLLGGKSYSYRVRATDDAGNLGPYSNVDTAVTTAPASPPVTDNDPPAGGGNPAPDPVVSGAYYVAGSQANASDSNPGTEAQPWKTIVHAAKMAKAGDTVYVKAGTYTGQVVVANSGAAGKEIVLRAYPGDERKAVINGAGITVKAKSYIQIRGFKVQYAPYRGISIQGPDDASQPPSRFITVAGNHTYDTQSSGIAVWGVPWETDPKDYENVTDVVIENNLVERCCNGGYNECITVANGVIRADVRFNEVANGVPDAPHGGEGIDFKEGVRDSYIRGNRLHDLTRRSIYVDGGRQDTAITRNIHILDNVIWNDPSSAIMVMAEGPGDVDGVFIHNNLVVGAGGNGIGVYQHPEGVGVGNIDNIQIVNNTVIEGGRRGSGWGGISSNMPDATNIVIRNNIVQRGNGFDIKFTSHNTTVDHNLCRNSSCESKGDPLFVNPTLDPATWNYRLKAGSAATDWGSSVGAPRKDLAGTARPQGAAVDLGAYEFVP